MSVRSEPNPNKTGRVPTCSAQYRSSQYDTGVPTEPRTVQYRCRRLAAHSTDLYGIWPRAANRSQIRCVEYGLVQGSTARHSTIPAYPPHRTPCRPVGNMAARGEPNPNKTGRVPTHSAQYRCRRLAAHGTDLYGISPHAANRSQIRCVEYACVQGSTARHSTIPPSPLRRAPY